MASWCLQNKIQTYLSSNLESGPHPNTSTFISNLTSMKYVLATQAFRVSKLPTLSMRVSQSMVQLTLHLLRTEFSTMCINSMYPKNVMNEWVNESTLFIHFSSEASVPFFLFSPTLMLNLVSTGFISPCTVINSLTIRLTQEFYLPSTYLHGWQEICSPLEIPKEARSNYLILPPPNSCDVSQPSIFHQQHKNQISQPVLTNPVRADSCLGWLFAVGLEVAEKWLKMIYCQKGVPCDASQGDERQCCSNEQISRQCLWSHCKLLPVRWPRGIQKPP